MNSIKDLIYFDYDKAKSLNSQLNDGLLSRLTKTIEEESGDNSEIGIDIKILKAKVGGNGKDKNIKTETIEIYHELLNQIETSLFKKGILTDINDKFENDGKSFNDFLQEVPSFKYIKATGWSTFEDFERFKRIMSNFNEIQRLIYGSAIKNNPEIKKQKEQINELKRDLKKNPNSQKELIRLIAIEKNFDKQLESQVNANFLDETFIEGVQIFLDTFSAHRLNFRLAPFDIFNDFQILANLKNEYLVNGSFDDIIYTYGSRPNIKLSVFGIITSCPQKKDNRKDLNDEYLGYDDSELEDSELFIKAFRNVFSSFQGFEKFFFVPSYPKISISPIAIYQEIIY
ncbi:DUF6414 family protein [Sphingobacterium spiritivorum]|nr:hypothetical protein [Sphingobacterium spiritivorum]QQT36355.1 hypothetical protein I6J01_02695 [Sphingobacterium spiritivorum]WQD33101.1 hypothetical protein U0038_16395 [Sphingobacterium spiritivorum]SUJ18704.1 Uncharacterised protein [Sphingobacterium spiritivorum]